MRVITKLIQTCEACPSQWDAWLVDGTYLYIRYRWGVLSWSFNDSDDRDSIRLDDDMAGVLSTEDMLSVLRNEGVIFGAVLDTTQANQAS